MKSNRTESLVLSVAITVIAAIVLFPVFLECAQVYKTLAAALHVVSTVN